MLKVDDISFSYGMFSIRDINFEVNRGEILSLLGPNGAGKSTLLKLIFGRLKPTKGKISIDGVNVFELSQRERARYMGFVPQHHHPAFSFRVIDFVLLGAAPEIGVFGLPLRNIGTER
ncbi:ATP-binding cassette domain-containing protein [Thermococcus sp.]